MANFNHHHNHAVLLLVFLFLIASSSSSSARLLNGVISLVATEPTLNIAFPSDGMFLKEKEEPAGHVSPCDDMAVVTGKVQSPEMSLSGGKYGPLLILNMLPKGKVPSSGPSKGTNNINN